MEQQNKKIQYAKSFREQLTARALLLGAAGSVVLTMSSMFVALKLSSLPWPIMFVALASMLVLKAWGKTNINEINVAHTAMSAGAMVAGGLAFTLPGIWMLRPEERVDAAPLFAVTLGGVALGLIFTALIRAAFVVKKALPYPMGQAAAEALKTGDAGGRKAAALFASMGFAALFTLGRDLLGKIPATFMSERLMAFGSMAGIWLSPMLMAIGYIIGPVFIGVWFLGAVLADGGILLMGQYYGWWNGETAAAIKSSLGVGLMVGTGLGIVFKEILPKAREIFAPLLKKSGKGDWILPLRQAPLVMAAAAFLLAYAAGMGMAASLLTIGGVWLATAMSAQCVGQTGINPMEVFGVIILLLVKAAVWVGQTEAFFIAAVVAVACGLAGDVMNDFKAGHLLKTDPKAQWIAEAVGSLVGASAAVLLLLVVVKAYGGGVFGTEMFPAAQAGMVAAMVGGISHLPSFALGVISAFLLYCGGFPVMTLGLGVYLPFFLSATVFAGGFLRFLVDKANPKFEKSGMGTIIASGLLGGESIVGVLLALYAAWQIMN